MVGAVVLAAGEARRFGSPKLLMPFGESTVLGSVIDALEGARVGPIVVVVGPNAETISELLHSRPVTIVRNPDPARGMLSSVQVGVEALPDLLDRFLVALGDQPRIRPEGVSYLLEEHARSAKRIVMPVCSGKRGHPVVFSADYRRGILALTDQQTLRDLIDAHRDDIAEVECASDAYVTDIDTRKEYEHEVRRWQADRQPRHPS